MEPKFSVGEWVERIMDGAVGVVRRMEQWDNDWVFYVDTDPQRPREDNVWAGTTSAWTRHFRWHAHVETDSADCDGRYTSGRIDEMTLQERCDQFGDLHFKERILGNAVTLHGHGTLTVTPDGLSWHEQTEEGYRANEVRWCEEDCEGRTWQRDHRAESMGY